MKSCKISLLSLYVRIIQYSYRFILSYNCSCINNVGTIRIEQDSIPVTGLLIPALYPGFVELIYSVWYQNKLLPILILSYSGEAKEMN